MIDYQLILRKRFKGKYRPINANDPAQIAMKQGEPSPTKQELDSLWPDVQDEAQKQRLIQQAEKQARDEALESLLEERIDRAKLDKVKADIASGKLKELPGNER